jgi:hypothetical protein
MACKNFNEDYLGFCGAAAFSHVPTISEMEQLCFNDFHKCRIYNESESGYVPVCHQRTVEPDPAIAMTNLQRECRHIHERAPSHLQRKHYVRT